MHLRQAGGRRTTARAQASGPARRATTRGRTRILPFSPSPPSPSRWPRLARAVVSDENVPEGHVGLHNELYGSEGAHEAVRVNDFTDVLDGELDGTGLFALEEWLGKREGTKPCGLYAIYDSDERLQFVGYARNIVLAVRGYTELKEDAAESCAFCRIKLISGKKLTSRAYLKEERAAWLATLEGGEALAESEVAGSAASRTDKEAAAHEELKLKMRKAMGDSLDAPEGAAEAEDAKQRRLNTIKAVEGDDWSEVIDRQTKDTMEEAPPAAPASPFSGGGGPQGGEAQAATAGSAMTAESVNAVLDEVRPYLIADGGNVSVARVEDGVIDLELEGACGSCASATATMSMGIERALRNHFGAQVREVRRVDPGASMAAGLGEGLTVADVDSQLDQLRPAIETYGGKVKVKVVEGGFCVVQYKGPPPLAKGIQAAIKDKFPTLATIKIESFD